jgi:hypothetical protein
MPSNQRHGFISPFGRKSDHLMRRLELKNSVLGQCDIFVFEFTIDRGPEITMDLHPFVVPIGPEGYSGRHLLRQQYPAKQWKWGPGVGEAAAFGVTLALSQGRHRSRLKGTP